MTNKKYKVDMIIEIIRENKLVPVNTLAEKVYGAATPENIKKLRRLITVCKIKGRKTANIYCVRGLYFDISSIVKDGSEG